MLTTGDRIDGRYRIDADLGKGGAALVYGATDLELERPVAVKVLTGSGQIVDPARFQEEARILAGLRHAHILQVYDSGIHQGYPYMVLELVSGGSLYSLVFTRGLTREEQGALGAGVLSALAAAHEAGVLHRDVKPENVLVTSDGEAKLCDFGLAKTPGSGVRTRSGFLLGTPEYMAPEIFRGEPASAATDVYAWGCLAYFMVNRSPPAAGSVSEIMRAHIDGCYRPGAEEGDLARTIRLALEPEPERRLDAGTLRRLLAGELPDPTGELAPAPVRSGLRRKPPPRRRPPRRRWPVAALLLGGALTGAALWAAARSPPPSGSRPRTPRSLDHLLEVWRPALGGLDAPGLIRSIHGRIFRDPDAADYIKVMGQHRREPSDQVRGDQIEPERDSLPLRQEFARDLPAFQALVEGERLTFLESDAILRTLRPLSFLDHYFEALGAAAPYGVRALDEAIYPRHIGPIGELPKDDHEVASIEEQAGPGRHLLFEWISEDDLAFPWLVAQGGEIHAEELQWLFLALMATGHRWNQDDHQWIRGRIRLGPRPSEDLGGARLDLEIGNFSAPQVLRIEVNDSPIIILRDPADGHEGRWRSREYRRQHLELELPPALFRGGVNDLKVEVRPLPGLLRYQGIEANRMVLELAAR